MSGSRPPDLSSFRAAHWSCQRPTPLERTWRNIVGMWVTWLKVPNWPVLSMSLAIAVLIRPVSSPSIRPIVTSRLIFASSHSASSSVPDVSVLRKRSRKPSFIRCQVSCRCVCCARLRVCTTSYKQTRAPWNGPSLLRHSRGRFVWSDRMPLVYKYR